MSKKRLSRATYFVCITVSNGNLISSQILSKSEKEATELFLKDFLISPQKIYGPFYKKKKQISQKVLKPLKFSSQAKKAIFNDWLVNAFILDDPKDHAYLLFLNRIDNKKISPPKDITTVPINDLRFI